ncbi:MAG: LysR family transcriptional regulator [Planctomycetota bacterium]
MDVLNFHHLRYFRAVAKEGSLTKAAKRLHVSQSALSTQVRQLEEQLGQALFVRAARSMQLTEAGQLALGYADTIFEAGEEMLTVLHDDGRPSLETLRIGSVATLSRNFQDNFIRPLLVRDDVALTVQSSSLRDLLARLRVHTLDVVLSNRRVHSSADDPWVCSRIARQPVSLIGKPQRGRGKHKKFRFPDDLSDRPLLLPGSDNDLRAGFDLLCSRVGLRYRLHAEVDDMALLRLMARDSDSIALVPSIVVRDELQAGVLVEYCEVPDLFEDFYAITVQRRFASPLLRELLKRSADEVLTP